MRALYHEDAIDDHGHYSRGPAKDSSTSCRRSRRQWKILHHNVTTVTSSWRDKAEGEVYILAFHKVREGERSYDMLIGGR